MYIQKVKIRQREQRKTYYVSISNGRELTGAVVTQIDTSALAKNIGFAMGEEKENLEIRDNKSNITNIKNYDGRITQGQLYNEDNDDAYIQYIGKEQVQKITLTN